MRRTAPGLFAVLLALTACASTGARPSDSPQTAQSDAASPSDDGIEHPTGAKPVLTVEEVGGFAMIEMLGTRVPSFVMLGDGRVIAHGMQTLEFPGPALPPLIERALTEEGIQEVLAAAEATNLFTADADLRGAMNVIADASDTVFRLNAGGREVAVSVYALGLLDPSMGNMEGIGSGEIEAHRVLGQLRDALMNLDGSVSPAGWETAGWQPYQPEAFRLYVRDMAGQPMDGGDLPDDVRRWPTEDDPAAFGEEQPGFGNGTRCGVVSGAVAETWLAELTAATQMTLWSTDGQDRFSVMARPLLPGDQEICPDLFAG